MAMSESARAARYAYQKQWRRKNREKVNAYQRQWKKDNPDKVKQYNASYWEKKAAEAAEAAEATEQ